MPFTHVAGNETPNGAEELALDGRNGLQIRGLIAPAQGAASRGAVVLCGGRTEFIEKYFEVIGELQARGFVVFTFDWRGQGLSGRETTDPQKGHYASFDDPVMDLAMVLRQMVDRLPHPHILVAHSMGGCIALRALQRREIDVAGALFSAPMWDIPSLSGPVKAFARFMTSLGFGESFAPGVQSRWKRENFKGNVVTQDHERHARCQGLIASDPRLALAGPTLGWVAAAADAIEGFHAPGALSHIRIPVTVLSAQGEALVDNAAHARLAATMARCTHQVVGGSFHEIMMERDPVRAVFWQAFDALAAEVAAAETAATAAR